MREIKFRAWDKQYGWIDADDFLLGDLDYESIVFEQFTGLLDKNGKEIWTGDILKLPLIKGDRFSKVHICPLKEVPTVCFFEEDGWEPLFYYVGKPDTCLEKVGNIHEHPELLEEGNE